MLRSKQRGMAMILIAVGLFAILAIAGLALEASHITYNKARLQGVIDATALAAAKVLDQTGSDEQATAAANTIFQQNIASFPEFKAILGATAVPTIRYSKLVNPFQSETSGTTGLHYVRVSIDQFATSSGLLRILGLNTLKVKASALAGPSPPVAIGCDIVPIALCSDGGSDNGYPASKIQALSSGSGTTPGFYRYLQFDDTGGASSLRQNLAGHYNQCVVVGTRVPIKSGVNAGPASQGLNTRFNQYSASLDPVNYPPDVILKTPNPQLTVDKSGVIKQGSNVVTLISQLNYSYSAYSAALRDGPYDVQPRPTGTGGFKRRVVAAPLIDCGAEVSKTVPVLGLRCLFMLQPAALSGSNAALFVEMVSQCEAGGRPGNEPPGALGGVYVIELYRDTTSPDS